MGFETSIEHVQAEIDRLAQLCDGYLDCLDGAAVPDRVGEATNVSAATDPTTLSPSVPAAAEDRARSIGEDIETSAAEARESEIALRLDRLTSAFDLSDAHRDVLLLALAPDVDPSFHELYRELHDDQAIDRPTLALVAGSR